MAASPVRQVTMYAGTATAARIGDAAGGVGVLLLAVDRFGAGRGAVVGGLLAAALTAPHALGPRTGRLLDRAADRRRVLAAACVVFGVALAGGAVLLHAGHAVVAAPALALAGAAGPLLTGGFSSLVSSLRGDRGRLRGIDAVTYGVAGTLGPAVVAALAAAASPFASLVVVAAVVVAAGPGALALPPASPRGAGGATRPGSRWVLLRSRPLRQVTVTTVAGSAAGGALAVAAVLLADELGGHASGGWFVAVTGLGNLIGALVVTWRPLHGEPVRQSLVLVVALAVATAAVAVVGSFVVGLIAFAVVGLLTAPWVTATLNARERYAPDGRTGEVFVALAGVKVAGTSAGTAVAGLVSGSGPRPVVVAAGVVVLTAVAAVSLPAAARRPAPG